MLAALKESAGHSGRRSQQEEALGDSETAGLGRFGNQKIVCPCHRARFFKGCKRSNKTQILPFK